MELGAFVKILAKPYIMCVLCPITLSEYYCFLYYLIYFANSFTCVFVLIIVLFFYQLFMR